MKKKNNFKIYRKDESHLNHWAVSYFFLGVLLVTGVGIYLSLKQDSELENEDQFVDEPSDEAELGESFDPELDDAIQEYTGIPPEEPACQPDSQ